MALNDISDPDAVRRAIAEYDEVGQEAFLERYGFGPARRFVVSFDGRQYDSKAILGAAHGYQFGTPLGPHNFSGGAPTTERLNSLGFEIVDLGNEVHHGRIFGEIPGVAVGSTFDSRADLAASGVHKPLEAGISYSQRIGADSVVVSGGYVDDRDLGSVIVYTGMGGNDLATHQQIADQVFTRGNMALAKNCDGGLPLRVVRGAGGDQLHSPSHGYRYDGLFRVDSFWEESGQQGYRIWRFRLVQVADPVVDADGSEGPDDSQPLDRVATTIQRLVRNTSIASDVKRLYGHKCQVCGIHVDTRAGPYAEGAHIRPLGSPHNGPDVRQNILCLCPNDHVRFDRGGLYLLDDLTVMDRIQDAVKGPLNVSPSHGIEAKYVRYHRSMFAD